MCGVDILKVSGTVSLKKAFFCTVLCVNGQAPVLWNNFSMGVGQVYLTMKMSVW